MDAYKQLLQIFEEIKMLSSLNGILYFDMNAYMPSNNKAVEYRAALFQYLSRKSHQLYTTSKIASLIDECKKANPNTVEQRNIELMERNYFYKTALSEDFVGKLASQSNKTLEIWKKAKNKQDFSMVLPDLDKLYELNVRKAELYAEKKGMNDPFNALIDSRDKGYTVELLTSLFQKVKAFLVPFIKKLESKKDYVDSSFLSRFVEKSKQTKAVESLARFLGYDYYSENAVGHIAEVEHPLTIGCGLKDVRVTVKYHKNNVLGAFLAGAHECGHALHSLQGNDKWFNQPIYRLSSPSFGESQSRFFENMIVSSKPFWSYFYPHFQEITGTFDDIEMIDFYKALNAVNPSFIRIHADEVTYLLHIIIRFEIEREWFAENILTQELPQIWNEKYEEYLGVEVPNDSLGIMQDLHWFSQYYGYFFGYGIGDLISAQLSHKISQNLPNWQSGLTKGNISNILGWLKENVHELGGLYDPLVLIEKVTGDHLKAGYFIDYLRDKYMDIYDL